MGLSLPSSCILDQESLSQTLDKLLAWLKWLLPFPAQGEPQGEENAALFRGAGSRISWNTVLS